MLTIARHDQAVRQRGLTLVELLVGLAVGLFVVAGSLTMLANFSGENRRLLQETRLVQDLRATSDLVTRDIRRAGYWRAASSGIWVPGGPTVPPHNNYANMHAAACDATTLPAAVAVPSASVSGICYYVAQDADNIADVSDRYGFKLLDGAVWAFVAGGPQQQLTDPNAITVTTFSIDGTRSQTLDASSYCSKTCTTNCPQVTVREFAVTITGNVPGDASIARTLRSDVRVRNDAYAGQCP